MRASPRDGYKFILLQPVQSAVAEGVTLKHVLREKHKLTKVYFSGEEKNVINRVPELDRDCVL